MKCKFFAFYGKNQLLSSTLFSRKGAKPAKENKDKFFKNLSVFAPLRENLI